MTASSLHRHALARHARGRHYRLAPRAGKDTGARTLMHVRNCRAAVLRRRAPYVAFTRDAREID
ncbi:hypothetical protein C6P92_22820 [Burkholderia multivorans]|nr:hypothetical protein C6P92_22820 [Burkholderia multivorans]PRG27702.1 hypothetical protein C6T62_26010 [Burkholderia multivorans]